MFVIMAIIAPAASRMRGKRVRHTVNNRREGRQRGFLAHKRGGIQHPPIPPFMKSEDSIFSPPCNTLIFSAQ